MSSTSQWNNMVDQHASTAATVAANIVQVREVKFRYDDARLWSFQLVRAMLRRSVNPAGVMVQFHLLALNEPHRVAKLLLSLEAGRYGNVLRGLHAYRAPLTGGTLDGTVDEGCYGDVPYGDLEDAKDEASADAEHYGY